MNPVAIDTDAFLRATAPQVYHMPDGGAQVPTVALWWRREHPCPGATWHLCNIELNLSGLAAVDDYGSLVLAEVRS